MSTELTHYGIKGMKWGRRKARDSMGLNRRQQAFREMQMTRRDNWGKALGNGKVTGVGNRVRRAGTRVFAPTKMNRAVWQKYNTLTRDAQIKRIETGKMNFRDKISMNMNVPVRDILFEKKPKG